MHVPADFILTKFWMIYVYRSHEEKERALFCCSLIRIIPELDLFCADPFMLDLLLIVSAVELII